MEKDDAWRHQTVEFFPIKSHNGGWEGLNDRYITDRNFFFFEFFFLFWRRESLGNFRRSCFPVLIRKI